MTKTYEYDEGPKARKNFEEGMKALFQVPKESAPAKKKPAKKRAKKTSARGVSRDSGGEA
ncbi:MAG TPA: hypothetical protein VJN64_13665 [Terriglobales bacterium]|nr:hypothetical protein [Terriglobales bacterium]